MFTKENMAGKFCSKSEYSDWFFANEYMKNHEFELGRKL